MFELHERFSQPVKFVMLYPIATTTFSSLHWELNVKCDIFLFVFSNKNLKVWAAFVFSPLLFSVCLFSVPEGMYV